MMGSLMAELEAREAAVRGRAEALRARIAELTGQLAGEEELLSRLGITRQTVLEILGGDDQGWGAFGGAGGRPGGVEVAQDGGQDGDEGVRAALRIDGPIARAALEAAPGPGRARVGAVTVPVWQAGMTEAVLPVAYRDVLEVLADAGQGLRTKQIAVALGLGGEHNGVEGLRSKLKRLVQRGWLAEPAVGLFVGRTPAESASESASTST